MYITYEFLIQAFLKKCNSWPMMMETTKPSKCWLIFHVNVAKWYFHQLLNSYVPLEDCSEFGYFVITFTEYLYHRWPWICSFCHQHSPALLPCYSLIYYFAMLTIVSLFVLCATIYLYMSLNILGSVYSYMNCFLNMKTNIRETLLVVL
jgi:hypothetical protein